MGFRARQRAFSQGMENILSGLEGIEREKIRQEGIARQERLRQEDFARQDEREKRARALQRENQAQQLTFQAAKEGVNVEGPSFQQSVQEFKDTGDAGGLSAFFGGIGERKQEQGQQLQLEKKEAIKEKRDFMAGEKEKERRFKASESAKDRQLKRSIKKATGITLTPGQKQLDKEFAKDFNKFTVQGGEADAVKGLTQLQEVSNELASGRDDLTGPFIGSLPDSIRKRVVPRSKAIQDAIEEVVQRNLRVILGAQFTEKEGVRLIQRAYDPALSEQENKKRVDRLMQQMNDALQAKRQAAAYYAQNGTLAGFSGPQITSANQFLADVPEKGLAQQGVISQAQAAPQAQQHPQAQDAVIWARQNPNDPRAARILKGLGVQ